MLNKTSNMSNTLSNREIEILRLVAFEFSTGEIASKLFISHHTVLTHRKNLLMKMCVRNTAGLIRRAFEQGYLTVASKIAS